MNRNELRKWQNKCAVQEITHVFMIVLLLVEQENMQKDVLKQATAKQAK